VIWVAVGGRGTLAGAILGAVLVNGFKSWFTGAIPELWLFALGALFVLTTLLLPRGIVGTLLHRKATKIKAPTSRDETNADDEEVAPEAPVDVRQEKLVRIGT
jgi:urea transport system permease protein